MVQSRPRVPGISGFVVGFEVLATSPAILAVSQMSSPVDGYTLVAAVPVRPANEGGR